MDDNMIKIEASIITETDKAWHMDCEGDKVWVPKSQCSFVLDNPEDIQGTGTLSIPEWLYNKKFEDEIIDP